MVIFVKLFFTFTAWVNSEVMRESVGVELAFDMTMNCCPTKNATTRNSMTEMMVTRGFGC